MICVDFAEKIYLIYIITSTIVQTTFTKVAVCLLYSDLAGCNWDCATLVINPLSRINLLSISTDSRQMIIVLANMQHTILQALNSQQPW